MDIPALFDRYEISFETVEEGVWRSSFADEEDEEYDLYVAAGEEWLHFAISPFTPSPAPECRRRLEETLLGLNQSVRLVRFAVDGDGDVALLADLPSASLSYSLFEATVDALIQTARTLGSGLARAATDPSFTFSRTKAAPTADRRPR